MDAHASLDAGLLVDRDDELVVAQHLSLPTPFVQVQDASGLGLEVRIARKDPATDAATDESRPRATNATPCCR